jgi:hypothetical protein
LAQLDGMSGAHVAIMVVYAILLGRVWVKARLTRDEIKRGPDPIGLGHMSQDLPNLIWVDCEMTGLDINKDALVEIAVLVTDAQLNVLGRGC